MSQVFLQWVTAEAWARVCPPCTWSYRRCLLTSRGDIAQRRDTRFHVEVGTEKVITASLLIGLRSRGAPHSQRAERNTKQEVN